MSHRLFNVCVIIPGVLLVSLQDHLSSLEMSGPGPSSGVACLGSLSFIIRRSFVSSNNITPVVPLYSHSFVINTSSFIFFLLRLASSKKFCLKRFCKWTKNTFVMFVFSRNLIGPHAPSLTVIGQHLARSQNMVYGGTFTDRA